MAETLPTDVVARRAGLTLTALTLINVMNYVDRYVLTAVLPSIQRELGLNDTQAGQLGTAFIVVYFVASPFFGLIGDRRARKNWLAFGIGLWSLATGLAGLATSFVTLLLARSIIGIGEAAYGTISPSLLSDYYPKTKRGRVMAVFCLAIPVGAALGYLLGGFIGKHWGWRSAFLGVGLPGLFLALFVWLFVKEPPRGRFDEPTPGPRLTLWQSYRELWQNRLYVWTVLGYAAYTFAIGGLSFWMPSYMIRVRELDPAHGMLIFGGITVVTGFVGTLVGGILGDRLLKLTPLAYTWVGSVAVSLGALATLAALLASSSVAFLVWLSLAELLLFLNTGPVNAIIINAVRPELRATAMAVSIFMIHFLGDAMSPTLMGNLSDRFNLQLAMLCVPAVFLVAGGLWAVSLVTERSR